MNYTVLPVYKTSFGYTFIYKYYRPILGFSKVYLMRHRVNLKSIIHTYEYNSVDSFKINKYDFGVENFPLVVENLIFKENMFISLTFKILFGKSETSPL